MSHLGQLYGSQTTSLPISGLMHVCYPQICGLNPSIVEMIGRRLPGGRDTPVQAFGAVQGCGCLSGHSKRINTNDQDGTDDMKWVDCKRQHWM